MFRVLFSKISAQTVIVAIFSLSIFGGVCLGMAANMRMATIVPMNAMEMPVMDCMTANGNICLMNFSQHLSQWQSLLKGLEKIFDPLIAALTTLFAITLLLRKRDNDEGLWKHRLRQQRIISSIIRPLDSIREAFSRGILHSQIYA